MDALTIGALAKELNSSLVNGKIDKLTPLDRFSVLFTIFNNGKNYNLLISAAPKDARIYLTKPHKAVETVSMPFFNNLKKNILYGKITNISAVTDERIVKIDIEAKNDLAETVNFTLIGEFMGKYANLILVNKSGVITEAMTHINGIESGKRSVLPGFKFADAENQDRISPHDTEALTAVLERYNGGNLKSYILSNVSGLSPQNINEVIYNCFKNDAPAILSSPDIKKTISEFIRLLDNSNIKPCVLFNTLRGNATGLFVRPYSSIDGEYKFYPTLNEAADIYYSGILMTKKIDNLKARLTGIMNSAINKTEKRLSAAEATKAASENFETDKIYGELITASLYKIKPSDKVLNAENYYLSPPEIVEIPLYENIPAAKTAQKYFKSYQKKKTAYNMILPSIESLKNEKEYLTGVLDALNSSENIDDLTAVEEELTFGGYIKTENNKKKNAAGNNKLSGVKRTEFSGYVILTGKNGLQNETLYKSSKPNDLWLHARDLSGAHTVIVNPKKALPPLAVILEAARITAVYSKAEKNEKIPIDYTFIKFVSKQKGAGLGKVIYTNQKTVFVTV